MDEEIFLIDGRPVPELKVVELRKELEQRNLPKSGNKKELVDRLLNYLREERAEQDRQQENQQNEQQQKEEHTAAAVAPDPSITDMVAQYLAQQQIQLEAARRDADKHRASTSSTEDQPTDMVQQKEISSPEKMPEKQPIADDAKDDEEEAAPSGSVQQPVAAEFIPEEPNAIPKTTTLQPSAPQLEERDEEQRIDRGGDSEAEEPAHRRSASSSDTSTEPGEEPDESKTPAMPQNEVEMEEEIGQSDARNKVNDQQYEEQATERIEDDDRQMLEETMEETGSGEFVPDEPTGRKEESMQSPTKPQQTIESSTKPAGGDEELDFEQEVDEDEINNGDEEEDEEERREPDDRGRKRQLQTSTPSPIPTSPERQKSTTTAKQLQDSQITTTESEGMEAVGIVDGGRVEIVSNVPTTTAKESSTEQLSGGFGQGRRGSFVAPGGRRRSSAAAGEKVVTVEQQAPFDEFTPEGFKRLRPVSPARQDVSRLIHIRGLKRPFTNRGLLELLSKFGTVDTDSFWIDGIKSNCIVTFETAEEAKLAREGLHNVVWPTASDAHLIVEYSSEDKLNRRKAEEKLPPAGAIDRKLNGGNGGGMAPAMMPPLPLAPPLMGRGGFGMEAGMMAPSSAHGGGLGLTIVVDNRAPDSFGPQVHIQHDKEQMRDVENRKRKAEELEKSQNTLDQLFKKTKTQPHLYFLPLTSEEVAKRYKNKSAVSSSSNHHKSSSGHRDGREGDNRHGHHHHSAASSSSATKGRSSGRDEHRGERDRGADRERRSGRR